jgi:2-polyprenyl-3-methyl-5-hydroxy-6-metoxy-1,4-benzoquinol methylase
MSERRTPVRERLVEEYDAWYDEKLSHDQGLAPWHLQAIKQRLLPRAEGLEALEIGCGSGAFARYLAEQRANVVATDFSPRAIEYAREHMLKDLPNARASVADAHDIPFPMKASTSLCAPLCSSTLTIRVGLSRR